MKKYIQKWKSKSLWSKIADIVFLALIIALITPGGRLTVGSFVNKIKSNIINPSINSEDELKTLSENDLNWILYDLEGEILNLSDFKDKVIFINVWATWCPPCVGEMPGIQKLYDKYKNNQNIKFFLISNENIENVKKFIKKKNYTFPVYISETNSPDAFKTSSIPATFLISKNNKIIINETGALKWSGEKMINVVEKLIKE